MNFSYLPRSAYQLGVILTGLAIGLAAYTSRPVPNPGSKTDEPRPDENRFTKVVLAEKLNDPLEMAILPD